MSEVCNQLYYGKKVFCYIRVHITPGKRETLMALHHISAAQSSPWNSIYRWNIVRIIEIKIILVYILILVSYFNSNTSETSTKVKQKSNIIIQNLIYFFRSTETLEAEVNVYQSSLRLRRVSWSMTGLWTFKNKIQNVY